MNEGGSTEGLYQRPSVLGVCSIGLESEAMQFIFDIWRHSNLCAVPACLNVVKVRVKPLHQRLPIVHGLPHGVIGLIVHGFVLHLLLLGMRVHHGRHVAEVEDALARVSIVFGVVRLLLRLAMWHSLRLGRPVAMNAVHGKIARPRCRERVQCGAHFVDFGDQWTVLLGHGKKADAAVHEIPVCFMLVGHGMAEEVDEWGKWITRNGTGTSYQDPCAKIDKDTEV